MMVLALALHLDPVYVGAHHLARFLVVAFAIAVVARRIASKRPSQKVVQASFSPEWGGTARVTRAGGGVT
jgi:hypothetical protein